MSLKISSEKINNPFLVDLLEKLADSFRKMDHDFFIIGATAVGVGNDHDFLYTQFVNGNQEAAHGGVECTDNQSAGILDEQNTLEKVTKE